MPVSLHFFLQSYLFVMTKFTTNYPLTNDMLREILYATTDPLQNTDQNLRSSASDYPCDCGGCGFVSYCFRAGTIHGQRYDGAKPGPDP